MNKLHIADEDKFVKGRSPEKAKELLDKAAPFGLERKVRTTINGYIVPKVIFGEQPEVKAETTEDAAEESSTETGNEEEDNASAQFDPSKANANEVIEYLEGADDAERERVLGEEKDGKARKSVLASENEGDK